MKDIAQCRGFSNGMWQSGSWEEIKKQQGGEEDTGSGPHTHAYTAGCICARGGEGASRDAPTVW